MLKRLLQVLPEKVRPRAVHRYLDRQALGVPGYKVVSFEVLHANHLFRLKPRDFVKAAHVNLHTVQAFNRRILRRGLQGANILWSFVGASLELYQSQRTEGVYRILDQNLVPRRFIYRILEEELKRWPGWQPGAKVFWDDPFISRQEEEWTHADCIVVPSPFVAEQLVALGVPRQRCAVIPYMADLKQLGTVPVKPSAHTPLRVLFIGEVSLRKGVPYLLHALRRLGPRLVQARLAGRILLAPEALRPFSDVAQFLGHVPRNQLKDLYSWADVFVFPSLIEGSALVTYEALASGLPIITTANAGSVIRDQIEGCIVPPRDVDALVERIAEYLEHPEKLRRHREAALARRDEWGFTAYQRRVLDLFNG